MSDRQVSDPQPPPPMIYGTGPLTDETLAAPAASPAADTKKTPAWKQWAVAGVVAAVLGAGAVVAINASRPDGTTAAVASAASTSGGTDAAAGTGTGGQAMPGGPGASGEITAIDGTTLTVASTDPMSQETSDVTVETSDATTVTESVDATIDDVAVGETVRVVGESSDGAVTASQVVVGADLAAGPGAGFGGTPPAGMTPPADGSLPEGVQPPTGGAGPGAFGRGTTGTVTAVDGTTMTVEAEDGTTTTVTLTDDTTYTVNKTISVDDLAVGDTVMVRGTATNDVVAADTIRKGELGAGGFGGGGPGQAPPAGAGPQDGSGDTTATTTA